MEEYLKTFIWLTILYTLQGLALGLFDAFPILLQVRGADISHLAFFSLVHWPFSLKLLWAPLVDNIYISQLGKRTTWITISQLSAASLIYLIYFNYNEFLVQNTNTFYSISLVAFISFLTIFFVATQDIAVDGLAIELLPKENVHLASTANTAGQSLGYAIGLVGFLAVTSKDFCNNYMFLREFESGLISERVFVLLCSLAFFLVTILMYTKKLEKNTYKFNKNDQSFNINNFIKSYKVINDFMAIKHIKHLCFYLLTMKITFAAIDGVFSMKLLEAGLSKDVLTAQTLPLIILKIISSFYLSHHLNNRHDTLRFWMKLYKINNFFVVLFGLILLLFQVGGKDVINSQICLAMLFVTMLIYGVVNCSNHMISMAYFALLSIGDSGGTRMTLLNTVSNFSSKWSSTLAVFLLRILPEVKKPPNNMNICLNKELYMTNIDVASCYLKNDGFYFEMIICFLFGSLWVKFYGEKFISLDILRQNEQVKTNKIT